MIAEILYNKAVNNIRLCVFDMDGLMLDSETVYFHNVMECNEKYGYGVPADLVLRSLGANEIETRASYLKAMGPDFPYDEFSSRTWQIQLECMKSHPIQKKKGIIELLDYLTENNIRKVVATSSSQYYAKDFLKDAGLYDYFDHVVYGDDLTESKPAPQIYLKAIEPFGFDKENILAFEDSSNGILSAYNAGLKVVHIPDIAIVEESTKEKCFAILHDLNEAIGLIEKMNSN